MKEEVFAVDGRIEVVVDSSLQICLRTPASPTLYAITNIDTFKDVLDQARRHVRITEDNAAIKRFREARGLPAPAEPGDDGWDPSGFRPAGRGTRP